MPTTPPITVSPPGDHASAWLILGGIVVFEIVAALLIRALRRPPLPYFSREFLLTPGERPFYAALRTVVPPGMMLCFKVRLCDLIDCAADARRRGYWAKIAQKHLDFVLADADTTEILLAIELDDRSHERAERRQRDAFLDEALTVAGIPLLRVPTARDYHAGALAASIHGLLRDSRRGRPAAVRMAG